MFGPESAPLVSIERLRSLPLFAGLTDGKLALVSPLARRREVRSGAVLLREGQPSRDLYVVDSGKFSLCLSASSGQRELCLLTLTGGEVIGWSSLLDQPTWLATVTAVKDSSVIVFDGQALTRLCEADYEVGFRVMRYLFAAVAIRLHDTRLQMLDMYGNA